MMMMMASLRIFLTICIMIIVHSPRGIMPIDIGVCYGMLGDNLPSAAAVIKLYKEKNIEKIRLFEPNPDVLNALKGSGIRITLGVKDEDARIIASSIYSATLWFEKTLKPYLDGNIFSYISVGNGAILGYFRVYIAPAMRNLESVLLIRNLTEIKVTTSVTASQALGNSYAKLPSDSTFTKEAHDVIVPCLRFLSNKGSPLMINIYPYFGFETDPGHIRLDYAQFTAKEPVVVDKNLSYYNMFDAMVDSFYWAMEKEGFNNVSVVVSESGWPSAGNVNATKDLAMTYNDNFVKHILKKNGTPKKPGAYIEGFIFGMFNENQRPDSLVQKNFGLFYPNMTPVYPFPSH